MSEEVFVDYADREIVLDDEVRAAILTKHPEIEPFVDLLSEVLSKPQEVRRSATDNRAVLYYYLAKNVLGGKWIVTVVKQIDRNFISTVYVTDKVKVGEIVWKK